MIPHDILIILSSLFFLYIIPTYLVLIIIFDFFGYWLLVFIASFIFIPLAQLCLKGVCDFSTKKRGIVGYYSNFYGIVAEKILDFEFLDKYIYKDYKDTVVSKTVYLTGGHLGTRKKYKEQNEQKTKDYIQKMENDGYRFAGTKDIISCRPYLLLLILFTGALTWGIFVTDPIMLSFVKNEN